MKIKKLEGNIDIFVSENEEEYNGEILKWNEILIHGDPKGLKSLANLLNELADFNQEIVEDKELPSGERKHIALIPSVDISKSSDNVIVGRLDAKKTGDFYKRFIP